MFLQTHKIGYNGINANFVLPTYLQFPSSLAPCDVNKLDDSWLTLLHFKVADFIGLVKFEWYSQTKVGDIDILVLWTAYEKLYRTQLQQPSRGRNHLRQQR